MHILICKTCERFREIEPLCFCEKAKIAQKNFYKNTEILYNEGKLTYSTFFSKYMPRGCKYIVGKKEKVKREYDKCLNCKNFHISEKRYKCTFKHNIVFGESLFKKQLPPDKCINKLEQELCMEIINESQRNKRQN